MTALALCEEESMSQRIFTAVEINNLKREAKKLSKRDGIPHVEALNRIALREGFATWWHLQHLSSKAQSASSSSSSSSSAETIIEDLLPDLAYRLMDEDDRVLGAMAETNAQPFEFDVGEVESADFDDDKEDRISFRASLQLAGEQNEESLFNGDTIVLKVSGVTVRTGNKWTFSEIEVAHVSTNA